MDAPHILIVENDATVQDVVVYKLLGRFNGSGVVGAIQINGGREQPVLTMK